MYLTYQWKGPYYFMNIRRKFLQTLDLRVKQHLAGQRATTSYSLGRLHTLESLASDHSEFKSTAQLEKTFDSSSL